MTLGLKHASEVFDFFALTAFGQISLRSMFLMKIFRKETYSPVFVSTLRLSAAEVFPDELVVLT